MTETPNDTPSEKWHWHDLDDIHDIHGQQLAEHGGAAGVRDANGIESAMMRPINRVNYGEPDAAELAATYAYGFAKNHGFVDSNSEPDGPPPAYS